MASVYSLYNAMKTDLTSAGLLIDPVGYENPADVYNIANRVKIDVEIGDITPLQEVAQFAEYFCDFVFFISAGATDAVEAGDVCNQAWVYLLKRVHEKAQSWGACDVSHQDGAMVFASSDDGVSMGFLTMRFRFRDRIYTTTGNFEITEG